MPSTASSASSQPWASRGFPVAKAYALCTDDAVIGAAFYIMSMEEGRVFWDPSLPSQTPAAAGGAIFTSKIETLAKLHTYDPQAIGLGEFGKPGNYFRASGRSLDQAEYRASETQAIPEMEKKLIEWLPRTRAAAGAGLDRSRRLSPRQHDFPRHRAQGDRGAGLGTLHARRSHGGFHLSLDAMDHARSRHCPTSRRAQYSEHGRKPRKSIAGRPAAPFPISIGISRTICSGSPALRRAIAGRIFAMAPRPAPRPWKISQTHRCRCRSRRGNTAQKAGGGVGAPSRCLK